jgi:hypothetical protein
MNIIRLGKNRISFKIQDFLLNKMINKIISQIYSNRNKLKSNNQFFILISKVCLMNLEEITNTI